MTGARTLYLVRHGAADALGELTEAGREQSRLIGRRLARLPLDAVWHSPMPGPLRWTGFPDGARP